MILRGHFTNFFAFIFTLLFGYCAFATEFQVIPLNSTSEKILKSSSLSPHVVSPDQSQKDFHQKTLRAFAKMSPLINFKNIDAFDFIYDSHFLTEAAFINKYSSFSKSSLQKARQIASEVYRP